MKRSRNERFTRFLSIFAVIIIICIIGHVVSVIVNNEPGNMFKGVTFSIVLALIIIWIVVFIIYLVYKNSYKRYEQEMEQRKTGMTYMAVVYELIYIVDLANDELYHIQGKDNINIEQFKNVGAVDKLKRIFLEDVAVGYRDNVEAFLDIEKLEERFLNDDVLCEYYSTDNKWCLIRIIPIAHEGSGTIDRFVFTTRDITDEKEKMRQAQRQAIENSKRNNDTLLERKEYSIIDIIDGALEDTSKIASLKGIEVKTDMSNNIPSRLIGSPGKIRLALSCMMMNAVMSTESGELVLKAYGKEQGKLYHLLIAVKDTSDGIYHSDSAFSIGLNITKEMLYIMNSELKTIREEGVGSEIYFEIDQEIAGS